MVPDCLKRECLIPFDLTLRVYDKTFSCRSVHPSNVPEWRICDKWAEDGTYKRMLSVLDMVSNYVRREVANGEKSETQQSE